MKALLSGNRIVRRTVLLTAMLPAITSHAQLPLPITPETESLAGAVTALLGDGVMTGVNPAAARYSDSSTVRMASSPFPLGIPGVVESSLVAGIPLSDRCRAGFGISGYGESRFYEMTLSGSFATLVTESFSAGATIRGHLLGSAGYPMRATTSSDIGVRTSVGERLRLGIAIINLLQPRLAGRALPQSLRIGVGTDLDSTTLLSADLVHVPGFTPTIAVGLSHSPATTWTIMSGFATEPLTLSGGFELLAGTWTVDAAAAWVAGVGMRESFGIGWWW
jgi:hypothetical protein